MKYRVPARLMIQGSQSRPSCVFEKKQKLWRWAGQPGLPACRPTASQGIPGDTKEQMLLSSLRGLVKPPLAEAWLRGSGSLEKQAATVA